MRTVYTSHLKGDQRIQQAPQGEKRIFKDANYEIRMLIYPAPHTERGPQEALVAIAVTYLQEDLQVVAKLWSHRITGDLEEYFKDSVRNLEKKGQNPVQMIGQAKKWCEIPLTPADVAYLEAAKAQG
jgi:hypothetical protein